MILLSLLQVGVGILHLHERTAKFLQRRQRKKTINFFQSLCRTQSSNHKAMDCILTLCLPFQAGVLLLYGMYEVMAPWQMGWRQLQWHQLYGMNLTRLPLTEECTGFPIWRGHRHRTALHPELLRAV